MLAIIKVQNKTLEMDEYQIFRIPSEKSNSYKFMTSIRAIGILSLIYMIPLFLMLIFIGKEPVIDLLSKHWIKILLLTVGLLVYFIIIEKTHKFRYGIGKFSFIQYIDEHNLKGFSKLALEKELKNPKKGRIILIPFEKITKIVLKKK